MRAVVYERDGSITLNGVPLVTRSGQPARWYREGDIDYWKADSANRSTNQQKDKEH